MFEKDKLFNRRLTVSILPYLRKSNLARARPPNNPKDLTITLHQRKHFAHRAVQTSENRPAHQAVSDIQLNQMRHRKKRLQILVIQSMARIHLQSKAMRQFRARDQS